MVDALITPSVIRWAREKAGYDVDTAAKKIGRPTVEIQEWEEGLKYPTLPQARKASEVYKRSLAVFYLPEPPGDFDTLRDFRKLPEGHSSDYSPELSFLVRRIIQQQRWVQEYLIAEGEAEKSFIGSKSIQTEEQAFAGAILRILGINPIEQIQCRGRREALNQLIDKVETAGIFVCRQGQIECEEARGFAIADSYAPFIFLNSKDALAGQLFTLAHELVHLWINESGISNLERVPERPSTDHEKIEVFCNQVASHVLVDQNIFIRMWITQQADQAVETRIQHLSNTFKVSEEVIARRLLGRRLISQDVYENLRRTYFERWREIMRNERNRQRQGSSGPSFYVLKAFTNGRLFTQTVISAYRNNQISGREISGLLDVKINHVPKLAQQVGMGFDSAKRGGI